MKLQEGQAVTDTREFDEESRLLESRIETEIRIGLDEKQTDR
jgi:hypothetical protein